MLSALVAVVLLAASAHSALSQSLRYLNRTVAPGKEIEFQWSNYDGATCRDNGYARLEINTKPKLGEFRAVKRRVTQESGQCKGSRFSVLYVYYVAGRARGTDTASYTIHGGGSIQINLSIDVK